MKKLFEILWLVKTRCFHCSRHHPSCSLVFEMHRLNRPLPSVTCHFLFPVMSHFRGKGQTGRKGQQVELSEQVSCLKWAMWGIGMGSADTVWGRSRPDLLGLWLWTPCCLTPSPFHHTFSFSFLWFSPCYSSCESSCSLYHQASSCSSYAAHVSVWISVCDIQLFPSLSFLSAIISIFNGI